jgi:hypothetical protein
MESGRTLQANTVRRLLVIDLLLSDQKTNEHSGGTFIVQGSIRCARIIARPDFRDNAANLTVIFVQHQTRVSLGIIRLQPEEFICHFLVSHIESRELLAPVSPTLQRLLAGDQECFVFCTNRCLETKFCVHVLFPAAIPMHAAHQSVK